MLISRLLLIVNQIIRNIARKVNKSSSKALFKRKTNRKFYSNEIRFFIFSNYIDRKSIIIITNKYKNNKSLVFRIIYKVKRRIKRVLRHTEVPGNELANKLVKKASKLSTVQEETSWALFGRKVKELRTKE